MEGEGGQGEMKGEGGQGEMEGGGRAGGRGDRVVGSGGGGMGDGVVLALMAICEAQYLCHHLSHCVLIMYPLRHVLVVASTSHGLIIVSPLCSCHPILLLGCCCCCHIQ